MANNKYIASSLSTNEEIMFTFKHHWLVWLKWWGVFFLVLILGLATFGLTLLIAVYYYFYIKGWERAVTNKRVVTKTGVISRNTEEMRLGSIETVELRQTIFQRIFGTGTVKLTGRGVSNIFIKDVADPAQVKKEIESAMD